MELPKTYKEAAERIQDLIVSLKEGNVSDNEFEVGWQAIAFLYPGLHPDDSAGWGKHEKKPVTALEIVVNRINPALIGPNYEMSGWPIVLEPIRQEAWNRFCNQPDRLYATVAQSAGIECKTIAGE